jgi:energy-coupling factor transport system substrate-specific component
MNTKKLQAKDLINVGIFTVIYIVLYYVAMMIGYIPIFIVLLPLVCPIICGIPFMLYITKIRCFGMVTLTGIICGLLMMLMGSGVLVLIAGIIFGLAGDLIMYIGKYKSFKYSVLGYSVFSIWTMGFVGRMFLTRDSFFAEMASGYGQEYSETLMSYTPNWVFPVLFVVAFVGGVIGAFLGKAVLKKHFQRAGIV